MEPEAVGWQRKPHGAHNIAKSKSLTLQPVLRHPEAGLLSFYHRGAAAERPWGSLSEAAESDCGQSHSALVSFCFLNGKCKTGYVQAWPLIWGGS